MLAAALAMLVAALPSVAVARTPPPAKTPQSRAAAKEPCVDAYRDVKAQGTSCHVDDGLWKIKSPNGAFSLSHGPDPAPDAPAFESGQHGVFSPDATPRSPICANTNAVFAIIARAANVAGDMTAAGYRAQLREIDGILYQAAVESGSTGGEHFRMVCDNTSAIRVDVVQLGFNWQDADFARIKSALQNLGYDSASLKFAVYWDAPIPGGFGGQGDLATDESDSGTNRNNQGGNYAINYDSTTEVGFHEMGHTLGAVQDGAPFSNGWDGRTGGHCFEDFDVMCYVGADGGSRDPGTLTHRCTDFDHFDCMHDSYFDARIGSGQGVDPGAYLATHWNIGDCYVVWVDNSFCSGGGAPANDAFANAGAIAHTPFQVTGVGQDAATTQAGEPDPTCATIGRTVWYRFTPVRDMTVTADTVGDTTAPAGRFDTVLAVYRGTSLGSLVQVGCNDDIDNPAGNLNSRVQVALTAGETYYFQAGGFRDPPSGSVQTGETVGGLTFSLRGQPPPNDAFATATTATQPPYVDKFVATDEATDEAGEPEPSCAATGKTVWYRITPTVSRRLVADTLGHDLDTPDSDFDTVLAVYRGTALNALTPIACSDDIDGASDNLRSRAAWDAQGGQTYYVQVGGYRGTGEAASDVHAGQLNFGLTGPSAPANDDFADAAPFGSLPFAPLGGVLTLGATDEPGEPSPTCGDTGDTAWYRFRPTRNLRVAATTAGSDYDTVMAAYRGTSLGGLTQVACNDDINASEDNPNRRSRVQFDAVAGQTYYFQAGGFVPQGGTPEVGHLLFRASEVAVPKPPPPRPRPFSSVVLPSGPVKVGRKGRARIRLGCVARGGDDSCVGRLRLIRKGKSIGRSTYSFDAGTTTVVRPKLTRKARRTLRRRGSIRARLKAETFQLNRLPNVVATRRVRLVRG